MSNCVIRWKHFYWAPAPTKNTCSVTLPVAFMTPQCCLSHAHLVKMPVQAFPERFSTYVFHLYLLTHFMHWSTPLKNNHVPCQTSIQVGNVPSAGITQPGFICLSERLRRPLMRCWELWQSTKSSVTHLFGGNCYCFTKALKSLARKKCGVCSSKAAPCCHWKGVCFYKYPSLKMPLFV